LLRVERFLQGTDANHWSSLAFGITNYRLQISNPSN
jgi:hypothetical protein